MRVDRGHRPGTTCSTVTCYFFFLHRENLKLAKPGQDSCLYTQHKDHHSAKLPSSLVTEEWNHGNSGGKTAPMHHGDDKNNTSQRCSLHVLSACQQSLDQHNDWSTRERL